MRNISQTTTGTVITRIEVNNGLKFNGLRVDINCGPSYFATPYRIVTGHACIAIYMKLKTIIKQEEKKHHDLYTFSR